MPPSLIGRRKVLAAAALALLGLVALLLWQLRPAVEARVTGLHQRSVTRSLAKWAQEDSVITNEATAIHAAEMVEYVSRYYLPAEGYRGPADIEAALETQRQQTITQLVASLERYTGLGYGTNFRRWAEWAHEKNAANAHH